MKREKATQLIREMLARIDAGQSDRPLSMIHELCLFGSYARGATEPHDIDLLVVFRPDRQYASHMATSETYGRNPHVELRRLLIGSSRSFDIHFGGKEFVEWKLTTIWKRGDSLPDALTHLDSIRVDPKASRAPRDAMLPAFEGLDRWVPRWARENACTAVEAGAIRIERVELAGQTVQNQEILDELQWRWKPNSPLLKAAIAAAADWESRGIDPGRSHMHGSDLRDQKTPYFASFAFRYWHAIPRCLTDCGGVEWLEVVRPQQRLPLPALKITPLDPQKLANLRWT